MDTSKIKYPRRVFFRGLLFQLACVILGWLTRLEIVGKENIPKSGPLLVVFNHFNFIDPVMLVRVTNWPIDFLGGYVNPAAPPVVKMIPKIWGYYPVFRGTGSRDSLKAAEAVLKQNGILGIAPEAGSWATVLRPARPGTAYLAARTGAMLLPIGMDGIPDIFPSLKQGKRAKVRLVIGEPFGPYSTSGRGRERREQLDEIGHDIMRHIAELIPPERRGYYSDDPAIREAAKGTEIYPWDDAVETDFKMGEQL